MISAGSEGTVLDCTRRGSRPYRREASSEGRAAHQVGGVMRTSAILGILLMAGTAGAADLSTVDAMVKQAQKFGAQALSDDIFTKAKLLCLCHDGRDGAGWLGALAYTDVGVIGTPSESGDRLRVECYVPTYDVPGTGEAKLTTPCVSGGIGTFWEIVK